MEQQSVAMELIRGLKRKVNILLITNLIMAISFIISVYDSIKARDTNCNNNKSEIIETIKDVCGG